MRASSYVAGTAGPDGISFGPTSSGKTYISLYYHRGSGSSTKSCWSIPPSEEFDVFVRADWSKWAEDDGTMWGFVVGLVPLGTKNERLSKFPAPSNSRDQWHGYPVALLGSEAGPNVDLVQRWMQDQSITETLGYRILRRKV